jgi:hypothetical protein
VANSQKSIDDMRGKFVKEMDKLAVSLAGAVGRLPSNMLTEKIDAFKALTQYANTINRTPVSEEGNAIDQFREALGISGGSSGGGGGAGPGSDDGDDGDGEPDSDDDAESYDAEHGDTADTDGTALPEPAARVSGHSNGAVGAIDGATFAALRHSVRLPDDQ